MQTTIRPGDDIESLPLDMQDEIQGAFERGDETEVIHREDAAAGGQAIHYVMTRRLLLLLASTLLLTLAPSQASAQGLPTGPRWRIELVGGYVFEAYSILYPRFELLGSPGPVRAVKIPPIVAGDPPVLAVKESDENKLAACSVIYRQCYSMTLSNPGVYCSRTILYHNGLAWLEEERHWYFLFDTDVWFTKQAQFTYTEFAGWIGWTEDFAWYFGPWGTTPQPWFTAPNDPDQSWPVNQVVP